MLIVERGEEVLVIVLGMEFGIELGMVVITGGRSTGDALMDGSGQHAK